MHSAPRGGYWRIRIYILVSLFSFRPKALNVLVGGAWGGAPREGCNAPLRPPLLVAVADTGYGLGASKKLGLTTGGAQSAGRSARSQSKNSGQICLVLPLKPRLRTAGQVFPVGRLRLGWDRGGRRMAGAEVDGEAGAWVSVQLQVEGAGVGGPPGRGCSAR